MVFHDVSTESSPGIFLNISAFLQSFIFTETTSKKKILCTLSLSHTYYSLIYSFPDLFFSSPLQLSNTIRALGDMEEPHGFMSSDSDAMEKWGLLFLCVWYKILVEHF